MFFILGFLNVPREYNINQGRILGALGPRPPGSLKKGKGKDEKKRKKGEKEREKERKEGDKTGKDR